MLCKNFTIMILQNIDYAIVSNITVLLKMLLLSYKTLYINTQYIISIYLNILFYIIYLHK